MTDLPEFNPTEGPGEVIQHDPPTSDRSLARRVALQVLYEVDSVGHEAGEVTAVHLQARQLARKPSRYVRDMVNGVVENQALIDRTIDQFARDFPVAQLSIVDRNILRLAILEMAIQARMPVGAAIDEAVQLARIFGAEGSMNFINGLLGALADDEETLRRLKTTGVASDEDSESEDEDVES